MENYFKINKRRMTIVEEEYLDNGRYVPLKTFPKQPSPISCRKARVSLSNRGTVGAAHGAYCVFTVYLSESNRLFFSGDG